MMTELHKEVVLALGDRQVEKHKRYGEWRMAPASVVSYIPSARKPDGTTDWAHVDEAGKVLDELVEMGLVSTQEAVNFGRPGKQYGLTDEGWTLYRDLEKQREDAHAKLVRTGLYRRTILAVGDEQLESKQSSGKWEMAWWHTCKLPDEAEEAMWKLVAILTCYCRPDEFCHRHLLAKYLEACGAVYGGELEP
jgi:hypothetical protein